MEAAIPHHRRNNNTLAPLETMTEEEKIVGPEGMIPTYPSRMIKTKERLKKTMKVKGRPHIRGERGTILGAEVPGYPMGAQPHERGGKSLSPDLHGHSSATNGITVYSRGVTLPTPNKVQNATDQSFRWNEGPRRPPQCLQEPDGATWIPRPHEMQSLCHYS